MARGWESKAIESQQDDAERRRRGMSQQRSDAPERADRRAALALARARAEADLALATRPAHRTMLQEALAALDDQLARLDRASDSD